MPEVPESWDSLPGALEGRRFARILRLDEVDSTNRYALDEARAGAEEGLVVVADHQSAGRGRAGRSWSAPPGASLLMSILTRPDLEPDRGHLVTMAAGVSACEAVFLAAGFAPSLKWPNDLVVGHHKLGGMLSEAELGSGRLAALVVGIGINVNWDGFPAELEGTATACNLVAGEPVDRAELLRRFLERFDERYATLFLPGGDQAVLDEYRRRCATLGRAVRVEMAGGGLVEGIAEAVDDGGQIVVRPDGGAPRAISVGDIVHLRPASG